MILKGNLYDFQVEDVEKLLTVKSVLIGNEMGTGKTYEAIALDLWRRDHVPDTWQTKAKTLVIAPLSVVPVWEAHFADLTDLSVVVLHPKNRREFLQCLQSPLYDVYILHWDVLRIIKEELKDVFWYHIIADEVHRVKNRKAQVTKALKHLSA